MTGRCLLCRLIICLLLQVGLCSPLMANERITSFDSFISVEPEGALTVIETISVIARGDRIRRGIYREFPTEYTTPAGHRVRTGFTVLAVERNGRAEPYHIKQMSNGTRIYIGDPDVLLKPGPATYTLTYRTDRQIGFFPEYDELYWNVTGNGWIFPIDQASAAVSLPPAAEILQHSVYTGSQGSTAENAEVTAATDHTISFRTTEPLAPHQGLTIAVAWPKGVVKQPDLADKTAYFLGNNLAVPAGSAALLVLLIYYLTVWTRVGRDPTVGVIIPRFEPPRDFTPAAARFIMRMGFDDKSFSAALISMAVKNYLHIREQDNTFTLSRTDNADSAALSRGERKLAAKLFEDSGSLEIKQINHRRLQEAMSALEKSLEVDFEAIHFRRNSLYLLPGLTITLLLIGAIIITAHDRAGAGFIAVWLSIWSAACYALILRAISSWKTASAGGFSLAGTGGALLVTLFAAPFLAGWFFGFFALISFASTGSAAILLALLGLNILFYHLLKAPTLHGRKIMDQLEGLRLYLAVAEKERLNLLNPPTKTPALFEKFLPWALALDVEQQWSEQFSEVLDRAAAGQQDYSPAWYHGSRPFSSHGFGTTMGSALTSQISSSSRAPGSSSGSGGGGSSGGGGGGGGGGGW